MDIRVKNYLGWALILSVLIIAVSGIAYVKVYYKSIPSMRTFSVSGEGEVVAVPDVAQFSFSLITQGGMDMTDLQEENSSKMNNAIDYLKSAGVDKKDIKTENYNLSPRYESDECPLYVSYCRPSLNPKIVGYTITQSVGVKIRDFSKVGEILAGIAKEGVNSVSGISFDIDEPEELQNEARKKAVDQAQAKAKDIAKVAGFKVGRLVSINESNWQIYKESSMARGMGGAVDVAIAPSIEPGSQEVVANVTLVYEIK